MLHDTAVCKETYGNMLEIYLTGRIRSIYDICKQPNVLSYF